MVQPRYRSPAVWGVLCIGTPQIDVTNNWKSLLINVTDYPSVKARVGALESAPNASDFTKQITAVRLGVDTKTGDLGKQITAVQSDVDTKTGDLDKQIAAVQSDVGTNADDLGKRITAVQSDVRNKTGDLGKQITAVQSDVENKTGNLGQKVAALDSKLSSLGTDVAGVELALGKANLEGFATKADLEALKAGRLATVAGDPGVGAKSAGDSALPANLSATIAAAVADYMVSAMAKVCV